MLDPSLDLFDNQFWVTLRNTDAIPDKGEQGVGEPVQPTQILDLLPVFKMQIQPNVKEFVEAEPGDVIGFESARSQVLARDVVITLERRDTPTHRSLSKRGSAG